MGHLESNFTPVLYMGRKGPKGQAKLRLRLLSSRKHATCVRPELSDIPLAHALFVSAVFHPTYLCVSQVRYSSSLTNELQGTENFYCSFCPWSDSCSGLFNLSFYVLDSRCLATSFSDPISSFATFTKVEHAYPDPKARLYYFLTEM